MTETFINHNSSFTFGTVRVGFPLTSLHPILEAAWLQLVCNPVMLGQTKQNVK